MGLLAAVALITVILASMLCGLVLRQLKRMKQSQRSSEAILSIEDVLPGHEYEVFLSFRGPDIRNNFADCLYRRLRCVGVHVFLDNEELRVGKEIGGELSKALDKSRICIPIFSQNYAASSWCLREVAHMVERFSKSDGKKEIFPIFYDVDPDDVKLKTKLYKKAILKHKKKFGSDELQRWEDALVKVAHLKGWDLKGKGQGELIDLVVEEVLCKLNVRNVNVPEYLVEDHRQIKALMEKLEVDSSDVLFLGIYGVGGIGKTVLARVVFNKLSSHFDGVCFLKDVRESSKNGLIDLQKKLLSSFVGFVGVNQIKDIEDGMRWIEKVCKTKKILLVLDDLNKKDQLEKLAGKSKWFGSGSKIIITTRDKSILMTEVESSNEEDQNQSKGILAYEVQAMEFRRALELFCKHAFRRDSPMEGYDHLAEKIVRRVGMLPLAIEVIGSTLYCEGLALEQHFDKRELWKDKLTKLDEGPFEDVRDALMISYRGLEKEQKEVFLDIACFFTNEDQAYPIIMWGDCKYHPPCAISVLLLRSLIKIGADKKFWMHDQVRDLGRYIVLEEYPCKENPRKFSRVWTREDAVKLLERKERNEDVQALSLTSDGCSHNFTAEELATLPNLRFLRVKSSDFSGNFKNHLSELRWLSWQTWQMTFQANNLHFRNLVVLNLSDSRIGDDWGGWSQMKMNKLKILDLTGCIQLKTTPDFSNFTSLEKLILARCIKLTAIHNSIGKLNLLKTLNIEGCSSLGEFPVEIGSLQSLTEIIMPQNIHPFIFPETFGDLHSLLSLILDKHPGISQLPSSIGGLVKVTRLSLCCCVGIKKLPRSIGKMKMLEELDLSKSGIAELPDSIGCLKKLKVIKVSYTVIRKFPCTIGQVHMLEELHAKKCWELTDENLEEIGKLSHLRLLDLSYTEVSKFPTVRDCLSRLQTLEISSSHLPEAQNLPPSLTRLHVQARHFPSTLHFTSLISLDYLELSRLNASIEEPGPTWTSDSSEEQLIYPLPSSLSILKFRGISLLPPLSNLERLSVLCVIEYPMLGFSVSEDLIHLKELKLSKCKFLKKISGLSLLKNLEHLYLNRLESLVEIDGLSKLNSLMHFHISHCGLIERLPNLSKLDKLGHIELEVCQKIRAIEGLEILEFDSNGCTILKRLTDVSTSTWLSHKVPKNKVFLSFIGSDTCYSIVDCLSKNLVSNRISVFRDDEEPSSSDGISEELPLDDSDIYIPFLSKNYASSGWHLRALAQMVQCTSKSNGGKKILPIFYDVEVDDVKLESNLYKNALAKHRREFGNEVEEWEKALREVADMRGLNLKRKSHRELIDLVVEGVLCKLNAKKVELPKRLVGGDANVQAIIKLLDVDSGGVRFVGIYGMSGIGKTTLAKVVFNILSSHFDGVSFLNDVRESSQHGLINLQKKLLSNFVGSVIVDQIEDDRVVMNQIKRVCETRKVLIVLDNVDEKEQLEKLAGKSDWFGSGSRIIITTKDQSLLHTPVESSSEEDQKETKGILTYELPPTEINHALLLFCNHAFKRNNFREGYDHLAQEIVYKLVGHPLAIEVIGSYLYCQGSNLEPQVDKRRLWEDTLKQLCEAKDIFPILMIGYEGLEDKQKDVFLDIACFFINEDQTYPVIMWDDCNYHPHSAIPILLQRSLLKIRENKFWMHDLLRDLGRYIIQKEYPRKFSRVWIREEVVELLERKERNEDVQALSLTAHGWSRNFGREELAALPNLRFLQAKGLEFFGNFESLLSELRWLSWQISETNFYANNFHFSNLVVLNLSNSNIEDGWSGWSQMKMDRLKVLDLTGCKQLTRTPDFSIFLTLEMLILTWCVNLTTIHSSICKLALLRTLNLEGCSSLGELPEEVGSLHSSTQIVMPQN